MRLQYCKVIILTSMVWVMVDVFVLMYFTDCTTSSVNCRAGDKGGNGEAAQPEAAKEDSGGFLQKIIPKGII